MPLSVPSSVSDRGDDGGWVEPESGARLFHVVIGEHVVGGGADQVLVTTLGSCVAACARDPVAAIGGMNHFLLPDAPEGLRDAGPPTRYGRAAMETLLEALLAAGCRRERLEFKVFGAGRVIPCPFDIAGLNAGFILSYLRQEGLTLVGHDLGGGFARRIFYYPTTGRVMRRVVRPETLSDTVDQELHVLSQMLADPRLARR